MIKRNQEGSCKGAIEVLLGVYVSHVYLLAALWNGDNAEQNMKLTFMHMEDVRIIL